jgi:hypothetical protein
MSRPFDHELTDRFGGVTAYTRAPAGGERCDEILVIGVMAKPSDRAWWTPFRHRLDARFRQYETFL